MNWRALVYLIVGLVVAAPVQAERVFKRVDESGNVTYESRPSYGDGSIQEQDISGGQDPSEAAIALDRASQEYPVTLYAIANCSPCDRLRNLLSKRKVPFTEKDPTSDKMLYKELKDLSGSSSVPVVVVGEDVVQQITDEAVNTALDSAGYPKPQEEDGASQEDTDQPPAE
jgi:glutaredoxin